EVPEEAVAELVREWPCPAQQQDDLLQEAYLGTRKGIVTHEPEKGALRPWVFFSALRQAQAFRKQDRRHTRRVVATMWDGVMEFCMNERPSVRVMGDPAGDRAALTGFRNRAAAAPFVAVGTLEVPDGGGEEAMVERMTAKRCKNGLERILGELSP